MKSLTQDDFTEVVEKLPPVDIFALSWRWGLRDLMTSGAMLAVVSSTDRASDARQVLLEGPDKERYPGPPGWGSGHGVDNSFPVKKIIVEKLYKTLAGCLSGKRPLARNKDKGIEEDLRKLGVRGWRSKALDREEWGSVLTAARAHNGL